MDRGINVLSLFDGMSCGQIALERTGIRVDNYYASEINPYAIKVTQKNYPNTVQLGDITQLNGSDLPKIDLLIGGSPCQGFSFSGKQLNFSDPRSKLFFEYVRLMKETNPKYFLLENVRMRKEYQDVISEHMGVEPIEIDSRLVSAQKRRRLYWTNIPNITQPEDRKIFLKDILIERDKLTDFDIPSEARINYILRRASKGWVKKGWNTINTDKAECLTAVSHKNLKEYVYEDEHGLRFLSYIELERLQTVPDDYTNCVSKAHRIEMLGNGWTVDVIVHILSHIPNF
jgi:site-specific DNA-cytosine methylase